MTNRTNATTYRTIDYAFRYNERALFHTTTPKSSIPSTIGKIKIFKVWNQRVQMNLEWLRVSECWHSTHSLHGYRCATTNPALPHSLIENEQGCEIVIPFISWDNSVWHNCNVHVCMFESMSSLTPTLVIYFIIY